MLFNHKSEIKINRPFIEKIENEKGRYYKLESGEIYPSITTVLRTLTNSGIQRWKEQVGEQEANRISKESTDVGTRVHDLIHYYLNNKPDEYVTFPDTYSISPELLFDAMKPELASIDKIYALEKELYSPEMKIAGTVDCIAEFDGVPSIIDFKTSRKPKTKSRIKNYLLQVTAYAEMWRELTGNVITQGVIIIVSWDGTCRSFKTDINEHLSDLWTVLVDYEKTLI